ncbi:MAG: YigZ family protein [Oscillospiraceae bacterium]|jgi:uncharacterized YigZ family protein|nr:YigZ family protein [Oscillospiraceae bacterium]
MADSGVAFRPSREGEAEYTEKRSRFIARIAPVLSEQEALGFLRLRREAHRDASHNVYAYRLKDGGFCRHCDDGEPRGTAGLPLLDVFVKRNVYDFCCVVTRYFGGVKLGAGPLARAYAKSGKDALENCGLAEIIAAARCEAAFPYTFYGQVSRLLERMGASAAESEFGETVAMVFLLDGAKAPLLRTELERITSGRADLRWKG